MHRIYDSVYGYIHLEDDEFKLVTSPIFQRLQRIKQLGPLHVVFPSAQHSRLSHSLGVFHIVTKMIQHFEKKGLQDSIGKSDEKALRFAALLHDIGHVPISHTGEKVLKKTYSIETKTDNIDAFDGKIDWRKLFEGYQGKNSKLHECLSAQIVLYNIEIDEILKDSYPDENARKNFKGKIAKIIVGTSDGEDERLGTLLHSELDADRLDFLLRDSTFTGVGYGHIDLDYIISRLQFVTDEGGIPRLCVEGKGLRTLEHYILARFFLQTQIIYNRKVRLLDRLFEDVMKYMIVDQKKKRIMNLQEFLEHIRGNESDSNKEKRAKLHDIYEYTDDLVFIEMRKLHDELDSKTRKWKESKKTTKNKEIYINDCIKLIMDAQIPKPLESHQKMIEVEKGKSEDYETQIERKANKIALDTAQKLGIHKERILVDVISEPVMKYTNLMFEEDEEPNREAVRFCYKNTEEKLCQDFAVNSNATILRWLVDRKLLMLNVYYIEHRNSEDAPKRDAIKAAYKDLVSSEFQNAPSKSGIKTGSTTES